MLVLSRKTKDSVVVGVPDGMALQVSPMVSLIRERLEEHPHFRGRTCLLQIESVGTSVVVSGRLPTYYLKQLLQEAIKVIPDVARIDNRVEVTFH